MLIHMQLFVEQQHCLNELHENTAACCILCNGQNLQTKLFQLLQDRI